MQHEVHIAAISLGDGDGFFGLLLRNNQVKNRIERR